MKLVEQLREEHVLIEEVLGAFRGWAASDTVEARDGACFVAFFREYAGAYHHGREEDTLFAALTRHADLAPGSGPVASLLAQHAEMGETLAEIAALVEEAGADPARRPALREALGRYSRALLAHIDAENSVLLPEAADRLARAGVRELPCRPPTAEEAAARALGERLAAAWPKPEDPEAIRGEGCVICPSLGVTCEGLEREWWTEAEWETFGERQG